MEQVTATISPVILAEVAFIDSLLWTLIIVVVLPIER
jgi:hypothetical protein